MSFTQGLIGFSNHIAERLSAGTDKSKGILFSEHTFAKARAVLPAEATTRMRFSSGLMRPQTLYASVSLNEPVVILAPWRGE